MPRGKHEGPNPSRARRVVAVSALSLVGGAATPLVAAGSAHAASQSFWDCIAHWESGGRWNLPYGTNDSTGGLQIETRTWRDFGGLQYASQAYQATEAQQIAVGERILAGQGVRAWTTSYHCRLDGGHAAPPPHQAPAKPQAPVKAPIAVVVKGERYTVKEGDCLWLIALAKYGRGEDWTKVYDANRAVVGGDPDLILPGQTLVLP